MLQQLLDSTQAVVQTNPWLAVPAVFLGGLLTASNPCVLAMIPLTIGFVSGGQGIKSARSAFAFSLFFVLGLAVMFTSMGIIAALVGRLFGNVSPVWNWIVAGVCLVMGLHLFGLFDLPIPKLEIRPAIRGGLGAFLLGLLFGIVSAPCAAPILVVLLTLIAGGGASVAYGGFLLLVYALGHCVLILIAGTSVGAAKAMLENRKLTAATGVLRQIAGVLIFGVGGYFIYRGFL